MPATAAAALTAAAMKRGGEDDVALFDSEVGLVSLDLRRGFVGHDASKSERKKPVEADA